MAKVCSLQIVAGNDICTHFGHTNLKYIKIMKEVASFGKKSMQSVAGTRH